MMINQAEQCDGDYSRDQRWDRIRGRLRWDSAFFFRTRSQNFVKNRTRSHFSTSAVGGHFLGKNMGELRLDQ